MEFCAGGDLGMLITERKSMRLRGRRDAYLPQYFIIKIFKQLISALNYSALMRWISFVLKSSFKPSASQIEH